MLERGDKNVAPASSLVPLSDIEALGILLVALAAKSRQLGSQPLFQSLVTMRGVR